ncbi:GATA transcription factor 13 [Hordeum vulgare]|nr:GATA transcription factor 13 [Hordeum vulgare]
MADGNGKWLAHFVELQVAFVLPLIPYVPCSVRSHLARYIEECRALAIRRGDTDIDLALHNSEGNLYHVLFRHGRMSSKFHGSSWEELVNDYGLRHRDMMTVRLEHYGTMIGVDFHRDGVMLFPLPCVVCEIIFCSSWDLSETQRELVDSCFHSRGVTLDYHQMYVMSRQLFDDNYILCTPLVHKMDSTNVISQHMVIPSMVVRSLKEFMSIPRTGSLTLEITLDSEDGDISMSIPCSYFIGLDGRMVLKKEGFAKKIPEVVNEVAAGRNSSLVVNEVSAARVMKEVSAAKRSSLGVKRRSLGVRFEVLNGAQRFEVLNAAERGVADDGMHEC